MSSVQQMKRWNKLGIFRVQAVPNYAERVPYTHRASLISMHMREVWLFRGGDFIDHINREDSDQSRILCNDENNRMKVGIGLE